MIDFPVKKLKYFIFMMLSILQFVKIATIKLNTATFNSLYLKTFALLPLNK